jgi:predicted phosphodiesterase
MQLELKQASQLLVFGGPYSNSRALAALRVRAQELGIDPAHTICTGDVVAYCAEPEETVTRTRQWGCHVVAGNCEEQLAANADDCGCGFAPETACNIAAKDWYAFARRRVTAASRVWMASLPRHLSFEFGGRRVRVVHGGIRQINRFVFGSERALIENELASTDAELVIGGHAGIPFVSGVERQAWFNPGVIGMPANDGTADVWYGIIARGGDGVVVSTHRLAYDHSAAAQAVTASGHADGYARALVSGLWPSLDVLPPAERSATGTPLREFSVCLP